MRNWSTLSEASRMQDATGQDGVPGDSGQELLDLAREIIRLARLATALHMAEAAGVPQETEPVPLGESA